MEYKGFIKRYKKNLIIYGAIFVCFFVLNRATILNTINPFGYGFLFSLIYLGKNAFILAGFYFITFVLYNFTLKGIITALSTISVSLLLYLIFKLLKKRINLFVTLLFSVLSQVAFIYFCITDISNIFSLIVMLIVGMMFIYVCIIALGALLKRGIQSKFTIDEGICFSLFLIACFSGLHGLYICDISFTNCIVLLMLLMTSRVFSKIAIIYLSVFAGIGVSIANANLIYIAIYVCYSLAIVSLIDKNKIFTAMSVVFVDIVLGLFYNSYGYYTFLNSVPLIIAVLFYLFLPKVVFEKLSGYSYVYDGNLINEYVISGEKELLKQKILKVSELFKQMQNTYMALSVGDLDRREACFVLVEDLTTKHCKNCPMYNQCLENEKIKEAIFQIFEFGMEKGKVSIIDANNLLTTNCKSLSSMIVEINQSLNNYFEYEKTIKSYDNSKIMISEQMSGSSDIFVELARVVGSGERINKKLSKELLDEFLINGVVVNEVAVFEGEYGVDNVVIVVRNQDVVSPSISICLSSLFKIEFICGARKNSRLNGWTILCYTPAPKYAISVGFASSSKEVKTISGDVYSFTKLSETKFLFALADGMGHGKSANEISSMALSLIESFYKAGFGSQTIISSVNKLLLPTCEENFTTLDACIVDVSNGTADFIKIGATASVIKSKQESKLITNDSLPLGIIGSVTPKAQKRVLKIGDIIVLATDGVVDVFDCLEDYLFYINNERVINVQMLADNILEEVVSREKEHSDDKTIIVIKLNEFTKTN